MHDNKRRERLIGALYFLIGALVLSLVQGCSRIWKCRAGKLSTVTNLCKGEWGFGREVFVAL